MESSNGAAPAASDLSNSNPAPTETDTLLNGRPKKAPRYSYVFWRQLGLFIWAVAATAIVVILATLSVHREQTSPNHGHGDGAKSNKSHAKRNVIFMVSDGMGPASLSMTRSFRQFVDELPINDTLTLDQHFLGSSRTRSSSSLITDSAAGATAFSCGMKTYNGAIAMLPDYKPCGTVMEAVKLAGMMTGMVVTTDLTDATPASFASHVYYRYQNDAIASQEVGEHPLGRVLDLMFGGGRCRFLPKSKDGCRADERDIVQLAQEKYGWSYIDNRERFDALEDGKTKLPLLGLFAPTDIPFEIDRRGLNELYPSLDEMVERALELLEDATRDSDHGFFLMIEGSRIDHAGHGNDPAAQVHEVLAYDKAVRRVLNFLNESSTDGVFISTSDHETGGLAVGRQIDEKYPQYLWFPSALANVTNSCEFLARKILNHNATHPDLPSSALRSYIETEIVGSGLGLSDVSPAELDALVLEPLKSDYLLADMISRRAQIGWSTHGHSAVDVNIYGFGEGLETLKGNKENTDIGGFLRDYLGVDLDEVTKTLREKMGTDLDGVAAIGGPEKWLGELPTSEDMTRSVDHRYRP